MRLSNSYIILFLILCQSMLAQEKVLLYSHYTYSGLAINPAYSGSKEMLSFGFSHRSQWIGFEGAPSYNIVGLHSPLKNEHVSLGILVMNESIGLRRNTGLYLNYAYRINTGNGKLAMGLKGGVSSGRFDKANLGNEDVILLRENEDYLLPNFGFGIYYQSKNINTGLSVPLILGYRTGQRGNIIPYHSFDNYAACFTMQVDITTSPNWTVRPSTLVQYSRSSGFILDAGAGVLYRNTISIGGSYRNKGAVIMLLSCNVSPQLGIGFTYDYGLKGINAYNRSSVEANLEYRFGYKIKASNPTVF